RLLAQRVILGVSKYVERHNGVHHGWVDRTQAVGHIEALHHPALGLADGLLAYSRRPKFLPRLDAAVEQQERVPPADQILALPEAEGNAFQEQFLEVESFRYGPARIVRMDNR